MNALSLRYIWVLNIVVKAFNWWEKWQIELVLPFLGLNAERIICTIWFFMKIKINQNCTFVAWNGSHESLYSFLTLTSSLYELRIFLFLTLKSRIPFADMSDDFLAICPDSGCSGAHSFYEDKYPINIRRNINPNQMK